MNEEKKVEIRFFILISVLILSALMGVFMVLKKSKTSAAQQAGEQPSLSFFREGQFFMGKGIVIVDVYGVIQFSQGQDMWGFPEMGIDYLVEKINRYTKNDKVKGMVLRINSPGGTIAAVQELYNAILNFRRSGKYVVASMGDIAASGGYYIASACNEIIANPGTLTGSIGVIISATSFQELFKKIGLGQYTFKSGRHKDILSPFRDMTPEERQIIQSVVDDAYEQFYAVVKKSRKMDDRLLRTYADGRIWTGAQAKRIKMVDKLGDLSQAIKLLGIKVGLGADPPIMKERITPWERLFSKLKDNQETAVERMLHLYSQNTTGIYYLYTP